MTNKEFFDKRPDLLKDIDQFHKKFAFEKNEKVGIPEDNELVNFRTSFFFFLLAE